MAHRFQVIRILNHHFLACWKELDPVASKNRGLLSLMRRHRHNLQPEQHTRLAAYLANQPALELIYRFKQRLCYLLLKKHRTRKQCAHLAPRFLRAVSQLRQAGLAQPVQLGDTLHAWREEMGAMWRFTRNNGINEGIPQQNGVDHRSSFRLPQLRKLQIQGDGLMRLTEMGLGSCLRCWRRAEFSAKLLLAERGGFEPPVDFKGLRRFSKPLLSTTQPPLRGVGVRF